MIIDLKSFVVTPAIAAHAMRYLMDNPCPLEVAVTGRSKLFTGWGGRTVTHCDGEWGLKSFRRFEYDWLDKMSGLAINVTATIAAFQNRAEMELNDE